MNKKWLYTIEQIRKTTTEEWISSNLLPYLDTMAKAWSEYFANQLPKYITLADEEIIQIEKNTIDIYQQLYQALYESLREIFRIGQHEQFQLDERLTETSPFAYSFEISDVRMEAYINERVGTLIKDVDVTTQKQIQNIIAKWQSSWETFEEIANNIYQRFTQYTETRSYLIARQELRTALEFGRKAQFSEDAKIVGVEWWKKAYDQEDDAVRATHNEASSAWWIPANQLFPWVEKERPPFDFWCRCTATYRLWHPDETQVFTP